jgi:mRNA-degrading endonuclease RelE of RelBE toxin-antitoxin system
MKHRTTKTFWKCFESLPESIKLKAKKQFELLKQNPHHPSLHLKKVGKFWSIRIDESYRVLGTKDEDGFIWLWIGNHDDYEKLLKNR